MYIFVVHMPSEVNKLKNSNKGNQADFEYDIFPFEALSGKHKQTKVAKRPL